MKTHRHRRRHIRRRPEPRIRVVPSEAIELRIRQEVSKAEAILANLTLDTALESPYLVSTIYYHDGLLDKVDVDKADADPAGRIVSHIARRMKPETKRDFVEVLRHACACSFSELRPDRLIAPVSYEPLDSRRRAVHAYAIDLFVAEGTPVRSATRGIVVLAENGWSAGDWFSTSTVRGGNSVIVFDADRDRFFRYAHLDVSKVEAGSFVESGDEIGVVGHSGFNASRKGHGRHLHFEINEFDRGVTTAVAHEDLEALLQSVRLPMRTPETNVSGVFLRYEQQANRRSDPE